LDIRLRSLNEIGRTAVLSVADGTVLRVRDGIPDRILIGPTIAIY
jgi:hypothetical protein